MNSHSTSTLAHVVTPHSTQISAAFAIHVSCCSGLPRAKAGFVFLESWKEVRSSDMSVATPAARPVLYRRTSC